MPLFYTPELLNDIIELGSDESLHCSRVLRLKTGDEVGFTDGRGTYCKASLISVGAKRTYATILTREFVSPRPNKLHMAVAPPKNNDRFEWFIEKATECGIDEITPIFCTRSERTSVKPERLRKIAIAAMKQAQRVYLPVINHGISFKDFLNQFKPSGLSLVGYCSNENKNRIKDVYLQHQNALILIGPEGDFSQDELNMAFDKGFKAISLGDYRLRTETAALVACLQVNFLNGEF